MRNSARKSEKGRKQLKLLLNLKQNGGCAQEQLEGLEDRQRGECQQRNRQYRGRNLLAPRPGLFATPDQAKQCEAGQRAHERGQQLQPEQQQQRERRERHAAPERRRGAGGRPSPGEPLFTTRQTNVDGSAVGPAGARRGLRVGVRRAVVLRLLFLLLFGSLVGAMPTHGAAGGRTQQPMVPGDMAGYAADRSALDAALGLGRRGNRDEGGENENRRRIWVFMTTPSSFCR